MIRALKPEERDRYNSVVTHPLQSWEWGEFREKTGLKIERLGFFEDGVLKKALQLTFHPIPMLGGTAGYLPKAFAPDGDQLAAIKQLGEKHNATFIKLEPNIYQPVGNNEPESAQFTQIDQFLEKNDAKMGRPLFSRHSFIIDLTQTEENLFANLSSKARYNVRLGIKKGVKIYEDSSEQGLIKYLEILGETTKRQQFYAHGPAYFKTMWSILQPKGMLKIFHASYEDQVLVSWIMFVFNQVLYYPYGASRDSFREVMPSNVMLWEMIKFGQSVGCKQFDLWGALPPNADEKHPWFGFHRFKQSYGGQHVEFLGSYDYVLNPSMYTIFRIVEKIRWKVLRLKAKLRF